MSQQFSLVAESNWNQFWKMGYILKVMSSKIWRNWKTTITSFGIVVNQAIMLMRFPLYQKTSLWNWGNMLSLLMAQLTSLKRWLIGVCKKKVLCSTRSRNPSVLFIQTGHLRILSLITHLRIRFKQRSQPYLNRMQIYLPESLHSSLKVISVIDWRFLKLNTLQLGGSHRSSNRLSQIDPIYQRL